MYHYIVSSYVQSNSRKEKTKQKDLLLSFYFLQGRALCHCTFLRRRRNSCFVILSLIFVLYHYLSCYNNKFFAFRDVCSVKVCDSLVNQIYKNLNYIPPKYDTIKCIYYKMDCVALVFFAFDVQTEHYFLLKRQFSKIKNENFHLNISLYRGNAFKQ